MNSFIILFFQSVGRARPVVLISIPDGTPGSYGPPNKKVEPAAPAGPAKVGKGKAETKNTASKPTAKQADIPAKKEKSPSPATGAEALSNQIQVQGEKVRALKEAKADKAAIGAEVKTLLELKASYKSAAGKDWAPEASAPSVPAATTAAPDLNAKVAAQGDLVRKLKTEKDNKTDIDAAVKALLALKLEYKASTGHDWKPEQSAAVVTAVPAAAVAKAAKAATPVKAQSPSASGNGGGFQRMT